MVVILAMGWHRQLSFETLVRHRAGIDAFVAEHYTAAIAAFVALYVAVAALSVPGAAVLTICGGILFGWLVGGVAAIAGGTTGATIIFSIARTACGESLIRCAGPRAQKAYGARAAPFRRARNGFDTAFVKPSELMRVTTSSLSTAKRRCRTSML